MNESTSNEQKKKDTPLVWALLAGCGCIVLILLLISILGVLVAVSDAA